MRWSHPDSTTMSWTPRDESAFFVPQSPVYKVETMGQWYLSVVD